MKPIGFDARSGNLVLVDGNVFPAGSLRLEVDPSGTCRIVSLAGRVELSVRWQEIARLDGTLFADETQALAYLQEILDWIPLDDALSAASRVAKSALSALRAVTIDPTGHIAYASADRLEDADRVLGLTRQAVDPDHPVPIRRDGLLTSPGWGLTPDQPLFLGLDGLVTQVPPTPPCRFLLKLGTALDPDTAYLRLSAPIRFS